MKTRKKIWFKCLSPKGKAINGGRYQYDLPRLVGGRWKAGGWTIPQEPDICQSGYHLTTKPFLWLESLMTNVVWVAEPAPHAKTSCHSYPSDKCAFSSVRLRRPASRRELAAMQMPWKLRRMVNQAKLWARQARAKAATAKRRSRR